LKNNYIKNFFKIITISLIPFFIYYLVINLFINNFFITNKLEKKNIIKFIKYKSLDLLIKLNYKLNIKIFNSKNDYHSSLKIIFINNNKNILKNAFDCKSENNIKHKIHIYGLLNNTGYFKNLIQKNYNILNHCNIFFDYKINNISNLNKKNINSENFIYYKNKFNTLKNIKGTMNKAVSIDSIVLPDEYLQKYLKDIGLFYLKEDYDHVIRKMPLVIRYDEVKDINLSDLREGIYIDRLILDGYKIQFNNKSKTYKLFKDKNILFNQGNIDYKNRKYLDKNDIYYINSEIEKIVNNFELELEIIRGRIDRNHKKIIQLIYKYLISCNMNDDMKSEIRYILSLPESKKEIDYILSGIVNDLTRLSKADNSLLKDKKYFNKLLKKCYKIDRKLINDNSLYKMLYGYKYDIYSNLYEVIENYLMTLPLLIISDYYNISKDNIDVIFGDKIILKNINNNKNQIIKIPIDKNGCSLINYSKFINSSNQSNLNNKLSLLVDNDELINTPINNIYDYQIITNINNNLPNIIFIKNLSGYFFYLILFLVCIISGYVGLSENIFKMIIFYITFILIFFIIIISLFYFNNIFLDFLNILLISLSTLIIILLFKKYTKIY